MRPVRNRLLLRLLHPLPFVFTQLWPGLVCLLLLACGPAASARDEWFRGLDLETAAGRADLILVVRVAEVGELKVTFGGKAERTDQQFKFEPVRTLKGVFTRDALLLTNLELGHSGEVHTPIERGQVRLLLLGRSGQGYVNVNQAETLDKSVPLLKDDKDPLLASLQVLIAVNQEHDRAKKVVLLLEGLGKAKGPSAVPLLAALQRRALLTAHTAAAAAGVTRHLGDSQPAVREAAARTLHALLAADYLDHRDLRETAVKSLTTALRDKSVDVAARVAALEALGMAGAPALKNDAAADQLKLDKPRDTFAEQAALLRVIGQAKLATQRQAVLAFLEHLPLDAAPDLQGVAEWALTQLDPDQALKTLTLRLKTKYAAGLEVQTEIHHLGELPPAAAAPALLDVFKLPLNHGEKVTFAVVCTRLADARLVPALASLLDPRRPDLRWHAVEALRKIDTDDAAKALQPHLREEGDLFRKLQIAEFLGRHGIRDGYSYAMEHLSEPQLLEQAVAALAAIKEPKAVPVLRDILKASNDTSWNGVAIRALGALGDKEQAPRLLEIVQDLKRPLAPAALIALGDLGEVKALPKVGEGLTSRSDRVVVASARTAGKLIGRTDADTVALRDQLAALFADADAGQEVRLAALDALLALKDPRVNRVLAAAVRDAGLEGSSLLDRIERLLRQRKVKLEVP